MARFIPLVPMSRGLGGAPVADPALCSRAPREASGSAAGDLYPSRPSLHKMWITLWTRLACANFLRGGDRASARGTAASL